MSHEILTTMGKNRTFFRCMPDIFRQRYGVRYIDPSLPDEFKDVDILVNNAGLVRGMAQAPDIEPEDMAVIFDTNVTGLINMTPAILPIFKTRLDGGRGDITNINSITGREPY
ncbi:hypothetical protein ANOM_000436 [Aspergillus nomiae NRRL 13137]|uniref:Uncharacterized protein n=1 Tax=Aspergillus nomiae NRRL (strain ATCC 15546 / NRRL 13137 / CBS 260.88 / M93) TaxID=1509407 RepID=A0A0L1JI06_ASPN3|nr:uncharacterized protein ANOM_000436 [Aspergillus nomiae NRRL 13137]KNG91394.1 hypothetical protein ANOM_000436 [Aspergillus nomiae NRRL 13137]